MEIANYFESLTKSQKLYAKNTFDINKEKVKKGADAFSKWFGTNKRNKTNKTIWLTLKNLNDNIHQDNDVMNLINAEFDTMYKNNVNFINTIEHLLNMNNYTCTVFSTDPIPFIKGVAYPYTTKEDVKITNPVKINKLIENIFKKITKEDLVDNLHSLYLDEIVSIYIAFLSRDTSNTKEWKKDWRRYMLLTGRADSKDYIELLNEFLDSEFGKDFFDYFKKTLINKVSTSHIRDQYKKVLSSKGDYMVCMSWNPYVIAEISTNKKWTSCMRLPSFRGNSPKDIKSLKNDLQKLGLNSVNDIENRLDSISEHKDAQEYNISNLEREIRSKEIQLENIKEYTEEEAASLKVALNVKKKRLLSLQNEYIFLKDEENKLNEIRDKYLDEKTSDFGGELHGKLKEDIDSGSFVAFLLPSGEAEDLNKSEARIIFKKYLQENTNKIFYIPTKIYGINHIAFLKIVIEWLLEKQGKIDLNKGEIRFPNSEVYRDNLYPSYRSFEAISFATKYDSIFRKLFVS